MPDEHTLLIDLDDTLYPRDSGIWEAIRERINAFIIGRLSVSPPEAHELRADYLRRYGATLNGLIAHHDVEPLDYLRYVHDIPVERLLSPDPDLRAMLINLSQEMVIFTNSYAGHAHRVLDRLGIRDLFPVIVDIIALEFQNKPALQAYQKVLSLCGDIDPHETVLIDDRVRNLAPGAELGMSTVLVGDEDQHDSFKPDYTIQSIRQLSEVIDDLTGESAGR